ncbi:MAG: PIN domain-containing protein [Gordonia amarae]
MVLDTTVLIDALRGRPAVQRIRDLRSTGGIPATTAINVEEIVRGMRPQEQRAIDSLLAGLVILSVDADAARLSGRWRSEYSARGITLHQADCLIAAAAAVHNARLCTGNPKDFPMREVEHWPVGR